MSTYPPNADLAWRNHMMAILDRGWLTSPRGQQTTEVLHVQHVAYDMSRPIVTSAARKLNYRFMVAEALWILSGSNELAPLQRFIKTYDRFSDDGATLFGAYGPHVVDQLDYVIDKLLMDRDTRQAVLTIWRQNPPTSKDIPCTIAMTFSIRDGKLHQHVYMRSSDAWLGVPYDMFSFAMVGVKVACAYNRNTGDPKVTLGAVTISPTSAHLYTKDYDAATLVLASERGPTTAPVPTELVLDGDWARIEDSLVAVREQHLCPPHGWTLFPGAWS